jgi:hypothetical protein
MSLSTFTWLDHAPDDARRVREALAAFDEKGMVDPLGFGVVRDAFSELLFPGTSTVQTRARYFLFVPWLYQRLDADGVSLADGAGHARASEVRLIEALLRGSPSHEGIIGRFARGRVSQLPSFVYWGGLGRWGIRRFAGTRRDYVATLVQRRRAREAEPGTARSDWHPNLPGEPDGLLESTSLSLTEEEADFLRDRILNSAPTSYLAALVRDGDSSQRGDTPWEHPLAAAMQGERAQQLHHAKLFAIITWGANLLYNAELSRLLVADGGRPLNVDFDGILGDWLAEVRALEHALASWDRAEFWQTVHMSTPVVPSSVVRFVDWWLDRVAADPQDAIGARDVRSTLASREATLKGARAKLANRRARERSPGAQGGELLTFRWPQVSRIVRDIHEGLEGHAEPA